MKTKENLSIAGLTIITTLVIGLLNTGTAVLAYSVFLHTRPKQAVNLQPITDVKPVKAQTTIHTPSQVNNGSAANTAKSAPHPTQVRKPQATIVIGQPALPTQIITKPDGQTEYKWCSGQNPSLEDGVCEAILSIASDPTPANPHLSEKVLQWLSLLPSNSTLKMNEQSWQPRTNGGEMDITMQTQAYGNMQLHVTLEKKNDIWVVTDGQIA
jgi:hypothetical protein